MEKDNSLPPIGEVTSRLRELIKKELKEASEKHGVIFDIWPSSYKHRKDWKVVLYPQENTRNKTTSSLYSASEEVSRITNLIAERLDQTSEKYGVIIDLWPSEENGKRSWKTLIYDKKMFDNPTLEIVDLKSWE